MKRPAILRSVLGLMSHGSATIRVATIWVIINLTWPDEKIAHGVHDRVILLRSLGVEDRLQSLNADHDLDVRDRVKTALHHFHLDQQQYGHNGNGMTEQAASTTGSNRPDHTLRLTGHGSTVDQDSQSDTRETLGSATTSPTMEGEGTSAHERR